MTKDSLNNYIWEAVIRRFCGKMTKTTKWLSKLILINLLSLWLINWLVVSAQSQAGLEFPSVEAVKINILHSYYLICVFILFNFLPECQQRTVICKSQLCLQTHHSQILFHSRMRMAPSECLFCFAVNIMSGLFFFRNMFCLVCINGVVYISE